MNPCDCTAPHDLKVLTVISTTLTRRGTGTEDSPHRIIRQLWCIHGNLLSELDPSTLSKASTLTNQTLET